MLDLNGLRKELIRCGVAPRHVRRTIDELSFCDAGTCREQQFDRVSAIHVESEVRPDEFPANNSWFKRLVVESCGPFYVAESCRESVNYVDVLQGDTERIADRNHIRNQLAPGYVQHRSRGSRGM